MTEPRTPRFPRLLVTGGAGFIGSCFVRDRLARRDGTQIAVLDKLTYAGNRANLASVEADPEQAARLRFVQGDIADPAVVAPLVAEADAVVNFAAESHVDRSILDPEAFLRTDVLGVHVLLEACRAEQERAVKGERSAAPRFLQVSTDEVYGSVESGESHEDDRLDPSSPYSAAKAAGELLVRSYFVTYGLDAVVTRGSNTYGPYHHPEKLIPLFITNAIDDRQLPLYGDGLQRRDWLYVGDHAGAVGHVLEHGMAGETYNIPGGNERDQPRGGGQAARAARQTLVARPAGRGSAGPRPPLRHGRFQARRPGLEKRDAVRGGPGHDRPVVPPQRGLVAADQVR